MIELPQHDLRQPLTDELHARPFVPIEGPTQVVHLAFLPEAGASRLSPAHDVAHLNALLEHLGATPLSAQDEAVPNVLLRELDGFHLKWERHTEFISFLFVFEDSGKALFAPKIEFLTPKAWLEESRLRTIAACQVEVLFADSETEVQRLAMQELAPHFAQDTLAMSWVTEHAGVAMCDFRIDGSGFTRVGVVAQNDEIGPGRLGRIVQRLIELETYRILAMSALPTARRLAPELTVIESRLAKTTRSIAEDYSANDADAARSTLDVLTELSADLEKFSSQTAYRFSASRAYEALVNERIESLRERRLARRQSFKDFMTRRFNPAMRTIRATDDRLNALSARGERAANLLRTRIDVALETQNQQLLESMNERAKLQLRLQEMVEGLSVVAISYYAVNLAVYVLAPVFKILGSDEKLTKALVALPVIAAVWFMVRRVRKGLTD